MLIDPFGRQIAYIRISVTDRCDLRCRYCMNEHMEFLPRKEILSLEEIERLAQTFVQAGVRKIRITGGEPLVRKGLLDLLARITRLRRIGLEELVMTTNANNLEAHAEALYRAGVSRLNISLDSLDAGRFSEITRVGKLSRVRAGIDAALAQPFKSIRINSVLMHGVNDDEVLELMEFALGRGMDIAFIEEMPLGEISSHERLFSCVSNDETEASIRQHYQLSPAQEMQQKHSGPARYYRVQGFDNLLGFISPHSHNFCASCNRVRLTAEGRLLLCLGNEHSVDFRSLLRDKAYTDAELSEAFIRALALKPEQHEFDLNEPPQIVRFMNMTGG